MSGFATVGAASDAHSNSGRGRLRHDLVFRRLPAELPDRPVRVLDAGCGTGAMALRLAAAGHPVTAADASDGMIAAAASRLSARPELATRVRFLNAAVEVPDGGGERFDLVCCHGVLTYLDEPATAVARLAGMVSPRRRRGVLSVLTKNRGAIGIREALRGEHTLALDPIESGSGASVGHLGVRPRGDTAEELDRLATEHDPTPLPWQGVRIPNDHRANEWAPWPDECASALATEWAASTRDPYRQIVRLVHTLARRASDGSCP
ncbi:class I SAM-dependent methyltransferase [Streptomyces sp. NPDC085479]|uniref:class I SAM-dependent methyltransferase n=1 Tax=Streptomyces sp. NPDC085479 TaxID=3365726 RepID=UPI0037D2235C